MTSEERIKILETTLKRCQRDYEEMIEVWKDHYKQNFGDKEYTKHLNSSPVSDLMVELQSSAHYIEAIVDGNYERAALIEKATS